MKDIQINLKVTESPHDLYKKDETTFFSRFSKYVSSSHRFKIEPDKLQIISAGDLFKSLIQHTFILEIQNDESKPMQGFVSEFEGELFFINSETNIKHLILLADKKIKIKDINKPILEKINNEKNTNLDEIFMPHLEKQLKKIVVSSIFARHTVYTKKTMLQRLTKIKWAILNDLRWALREVQKEIGIVEKVFTLDNHKTMIGIYPKVKMIHASFSGSEAARQPWDEAFPEESEMLIQGGDDGVVFSGNTSYSTAFVEIFPKYLNNNGLAFGSFIRGEGSNLVEAEEKAFILLKNAKECKNHKWEARGRSDGCGFCSKCRVFNSEAFPELKKKK